MIQRDALSIRFLSSEKDRLARSLAELAVDPYGIRIMAPKGASYCIRLGPISYPAANILKQEMLSLGGECALPRDIITGKVRSTFCILLATASQLLKLKEKLRAQPFGLEALGQGLFRALDNQEKKEYSVRLAGRSMSLKGRCRVMGIVNLTLDSFSGDGLFRSGRVEPEVIVEHCLGLCSQGADIIDIGGESSRPGAIPATAREELDRVIPVVRLLAKKTKTPISIDTYKPEVAARALSAGASIVNDITGLRTKTMAKLCGREKCGVVIMHMRGTPRTMQGHTGYPCLLDELSMFFSGALERCRQSGVREESVILDPGVGFAKTAEQNLEIIKNLSELRSLGRPLLVGVSRKSFIGKACGGIPPEERLAGSIAAGVLAARNGAAILRAHDVKETVQALTIASKIASA